MSENSQIESLSKIIEEQKFAISQISHEVRNPVTLINSSLKLIEKQHPEVQSFKYWKDMMQDMEYLLCLLDDVSNFNNSMLLKREPLNTSQWLTDFASSLFCIVPDSVHFSFHIPPLLPPVTADPVKLRRALSNLLRNGFEALEKKGEVLLTASADSQYLSLSVSDTGCGIPDEYLDTLYQPFVTHKAGGTGLGLSITKRIVEAHGGSLSLKTVPGAGTSFTMCLPLE